MRVPHARDGKLARVEAALLMADEPLLARRLADVAGLGDSAEAREQIARLQKLYDADGSAFQVEEIAGGYQLLTRPRYHSWLLRLKRTGHELRLATHRLSKRLQSSPTSNPSCGPRWRRFAASRAAKGSGY